MNPPSDQVTAVAHDLWTRATAQASSASDIQVAVERLFLRLRTGLVPWAGGDGYRSLLDRAIGEVERTHPMLAGLTFLGGDDPRTPVESEADSDAEELRTVTIALIAALLGAFGRFVGESLALRLATQIDMGDDGDGHVYDGAGK